MKAKESSIQKSIIEWATYTFIDIKDTAKGKINDYLFHIPNGGYRNKKEAFNFKLMGVKSGVPDLFFAYPSNNSHGMFLEVKSEKGILNTNQKNFLNLISKLNYKIEIIRSLEEAIKGFYNYLKG